VLFSLKIKKEKLPVVSEIVDMPAGGRLGISLSANRDLHLYVNGNLKSLLMIARKVPEPAYPLFYLNGRYRKVHRLKKEMRMV
jgi:hypothetical protein